MVCPPLSQRPPWPGRHVKHLRPPRGTHGHGSTHGQHPSRREHATVLVGVRVPSMAHSTNKGTNTHHNAPSSQILARFTWARTRNDACDHASPIVVHARLATHKPHLPCKAQHCTMSGKALCSPPYTAASQHIREGLREQCVMASPTRARAARAATAHAAAHQRQRFAARRTPATLCLPRAPSTNLHACD